LVSNALKYTEKDGIIKVNISTNLHDNEVTISVKDNGIGIPKEYKEKIFERFKQVENSLHKHYEAPPTPPPPPHPPPPPKKKNHP
ncbi:sensor histidine kinase, partial [Clostridium sp. ZBS18]|uniref:sensor histidine kinase n=1 Tax=Clostridium sp. ZBS18 TaxID=2949967 RepID=UPI00207A6111